MKKLLLLNIIHANNFTKLLKDKFILLPILLSHFLTRCEYWMPKTNSIQVFLKWSLKKKFCIAQWKCHVCPNNYTRDPTQTENIQMAWKNTEFDSNRLKW